MHCTTIPSLPSDVSSYSDVSFPNARPETQPNLCSLNSQPCPASHGPSPSAPLFCGGLNEPCSFTAMCPINTLLPYLKFFSLVNFHNPVKLTLPEGGLLGDGQDFHITADGASFSCQVAVLLVFKQYLYRAPRIYQAHICPGLRTLNGKTQAEWKGHTGA